MLTSRVADRIARDLPAMSTDELSITIDMANGWAADAHSAEDPATAIDLVRTLRTHLSEELERRKPKPARDG